MGVGLSHALPLAPPDAWREDGPDRFIHPNLPEWGTFPLGRALCRDLQRRYVQFALRLEEQGVIVKAAFVWSELLGQPRRAVALLDRRQHYTMAALVAEARGLDPSLVARQLFLAGEQEKAADLAIAHGALPDLLELLGPADSPDGQHLAPLRQRWSARLAAGGEARKAKRRRKDPAAPAGPDSPGRPASEALPFSTWYRCPPKSCCWPPRSVGSISWTPMAERSNISVRRPAGLPSLGGSRAIAGPQAKSRPSIAWTSTKAWQKPGSPRRSKRRAADYDGQRFAIVRDEAVELLDAAAPGCRVLRPFPKNGRGRQITGDGEESSCCCRSPEIYLWQLDRNRTAKEEAMPLPFDLAIFDLSPSGAVAALVRPNLAICLTRDDEVVGDPGRRLHEPALPRALLGPG